MYRHLFSLGLSLALAGCSSVNSSGFIVANGIFAGQAAHLNMVSTRTPTFDYQPDFVLRGHDIVAGNGLIIGWREFGATASLITDQGSFQKLTIWLATPTLKTGKFDVGRSNNIFWSSGSATFPGGSGCMGHVTNGTIDINSVPDGNALIELDLHFDQNHPIGIQKECRKLHFKKSFYAYKKTVFDLTYWDGKVGGDLISKAHTP